jgi:hypothetical protein
MQCYDLWKDLEAKAIDGDYLGAGSLRICLGVPNEEER